MKKYYINYANNVEKYLNQQKSNLDSAKKNLNFDEYISYSDKDIDHEFYEKNKFILTQRRGAGYWLWKPYVILKTLNEMQNGDLLFYLDVDHIILEDAKIDILFDYLNKDEKQMLGFELPDSTKTLTELLKKEFLIIDEELNTNKKTNLEIREMMIGVYDKLNNYLIKNNFILNSNYCCTKRDCFILMGQDDEKYYRDIQCAAGYVFLRKNDLTINFIKEWLKYSSDPRIITDQVNELGMGNISGFTHHRHDQSVYSLLIGKYDIPKIKWFNFHNKIFRDTNES